VSWRLIDLPVGVESNRHPEAAHPSRESQVSRRANRLRLTAAAVNQEIDLLASPPGRRRAQPLLDRNHYDRWPPTRNVARPFAQRRSCRSDGHSLEVIVQVPPLGEQHVHREVAAVTAKPTLKLVIRDLPRNEMRDQLTRLS
jgi:hypothetical protein